LKEPCPARGSAADHIRVFRGEVYSPRPDFPHVVPTAFEGSHMSAWINAIFKAAAVSKGGIVRRSKASVLKHASYRQLKSAVNRRKFHLLRNGGQYLIVCNRGDFRLLV
jgi:hypothetical protein